MKTSPQRRILHLIQSSGAYGAEKVILNLGVETAGSRYQAVVGALVDGSPGNETIAREAESLRIESHLVRISGKYGLGSYGTLKGLLRRLRIDLVHSHGYKPSILGYFPCRAARVPLISTCHLWPPKPDLKLRFYYGVERQVLRRMPLVVGVSRDICYILAEKGIIQKRIRLVQNGINMRLLEHGGGERDGLERLGFSTGDFVVGNVGRLSRQKDQATLVKAVGILRRRGIRARCLILGDGPLEGELRDMIGKESLEKEVCLPGFVERPYELVGGLDCFALPSIDEGLPIALLEAMALGRACVVTPVGEVPEVISDGVNGLIVPVGDANALADTLERVHKDGDLRRSLGAEAKKTVEERFSSRAMADRYARIYDEVLGAASGNAQ